MCRLRDPTNQPITVIEKLGKQFSCQREEAFVFESCNPPAVSQCACVCVCVRVACSISLSCRPFAPCHLLPPYVFWCLARHADSSK
jgi:hypothetical protein